MRWEAAVEGIKASGTDANPDCGTFSDKASRAAALPVLYRMTAGGSHVTHSPDKFDTGRRHQDCERGGVHRDVLD